MPGVFVKFYTLTIWDWGFTIFVLDTVSSTLVWVISLCNFFGCTGLSFFPKLVKKRDWVLKSLVSCLYNLA